MAISASEFVVSRLREERDDLYNVTKAYVANPFDRTTVNKAAAIIRAIDLRGLATEDSIEEDKELEWVDRTIDPPTLARGYIAQYGGSMSYPLLTAAAARWLSLMELHAPAAVSIDPDLQKGRWTIVACLHREGKIPTSEDEAIEILTRQP